MSDSTFTFILPSRRDFNRSLAEHKLLDSGERADLRRCLNACVEWQIRPRPRHWRVHHGGLTALPMGLSGPVREVADIFHKLVVHTRIDMRPASDDWQSWGEILLPSRTACT